MEKNTLRKSFRRYAIGAFKWLWWISLCSPSAFSLEFEPSLTFQHFQYENDVVASGAVLRGHWQSLLWEGGARLGQGLDRFRRLDTAGAVGWEFVPWASLRFRVHHQWVRGGTQTVIGPTLEVASRQWGYFHPYGEIGPFRRYFRVGGVIPVPGPWGNDSAEWDLLVRFGVELPPVRGVSVRLGVVTADSFEVYRLNNPAAELSASWSTDRVRWEVIGRYRLLLGFGRLDAFGVTIRANLIPF